MPDAWLLAMLSAGFLAYLAVGLAPFSFDFRRPARAHWIFVTPLNGVLNWLCFMPLGYLLASLSFVDRPVVVATVVCGTASLVVETLQLFVPGRYCCLSDWLLNTAGGMSGAWLAG